MVRKPYLKRLSTTTKSANSNKSLSTTTESADSNKILRCPPNVIWQHLWPVNETQYALAESPFSILPSEIMLHIFKYLSAHDLGNVSLVCRSFKMIADQDELWQSKCKTSTKLYSKSFKQIYMDWMYEKYLRNEEIERVERWFRENTVLHACAMVRRPPTYPVRPLGKHYFVPVGGFKQHPNESRDITIELPVDIDTTARELISLLEKASHFQMEWQQPTIIRQMITRYYRFMELKGSYPHLLLVPTLDIEIVWQTHLLRPNMYREDCLRLFRRSIDHSLLMNNIEQFLKEQAFFDTCKLYEERFHEQYCPLSATENDEPDSEYKDQPYFGPSIRVISVYSYWDKTHYIFSTNLTADYDTNPFSFTEADIILDGNWLHLCKNFMKEMLSTAVPHGFHRHYAAYIDLDSSAIKRLKKSYERFLYLSTKHQPTHGYAFVHPTYAIDIIWHSHMQEPLKYASDCHRLVGHIIDHIPWPSVDEKKMKKSCDDASIAWTKEFDTDISTDHLYNITTEKNIYSDD